MWYWFLGIVCFLLWPTECESCVGPRQVTSDFNMTMTGINKRANFSSNFTGRMYGDAPGKRFYGHFTGTYNLTGTPVFRMNINESLDENSFWVSTRAERLSDQQKLSESCIYIEVVGGIPSLNINDNSGMYHYVSENVREIEIPPYFAQREVLGPNCWPTAFNSSIRAGALVQYAKGVTFNAVWTVDPSVFQARPSECVKVARIRINPVSSDSNNIKYAWELLPLNGGNTSRRKRAVAAAKRAIVYLKQSVHEAASMAAAQHRMTVEIHN